MDERNPKDGVVSQFSYPENVKMSVYIVTMEMELKRVLKNEHFRPLASCIAITSIHGCDYTEAFSIAKNGPWSRL